MRLRRILILVAAAWSGSMVFKAQQPGGWLSSESASERSAYSAATGSGSLFETFQRAQNGEVSGGITPGYTSGGGGLGRVGAGGAGKMASSTSTSPAFAQPFSNNTSINTSAGSSAGSSVPVDLSLVKAAAIGDKEEVDELLAERRVKIDTRDGDKRTALMYAIWNGHEDIAIRLLAAGANIRLKDYNGYNGLDYAAGHGKVDTVESLLKYSHSKDDNHYVEYAKLIQSVYAGNIAYMPSGKLASINRITPQGRTPLHIASGNGSLGVIEELLKRGADVNVVNPDKQTPLHWAAWSNQAQAVELLVAKGADISKRDAAGNTALILAAQNNSTEAAKALLAKGADITIANKQGKTAYIVADDKGHKDLAVLLK